MTWATLKKMLDDGQRITVKCTSKIEELDIDECPDTDMMATIIHIGPDPDDKDSICCVLNVSGYENHNKTVAKHNWMDEHGQPTLTWFDTKWYPKDGICTIYVWGTMDSDIDIFEILPGCPCCHGDEAVYYKDNENNAFIDHTGEMLVTAHDHTIRFHVDRCPKCGFVFASSAVGE